MALLSTNQELKCLNTGCEARLVPCIAGQSYFCIKCNEEYYIRNGRMMKGSEALREAQNDAEKT